MAPAPPECAIGRTSAVTGAPRAGMRKEQMMKEYYKIGEISKLYNIGTDSLRYYEEIAYYGRGETKTATACTVSATSEP